MGKFKIGDKVKVVGHKETVAYFGGDSSCLSEIGTEGTVDKICDELASIKGEVYYLHVEDLILLENAEKEVLIEKANNLLDRADLLVDKIITNAHIAEQEKIESKLYNPLVAQEGGGHYKDKGIQPLEYTMKNSLSFCEGNVVKYISRYKSKNGVEDLAKVIHYALLASYEEYGEQGSTELKEKVLKLLGVTE